MPGFFEYSFPLFSHFSFSVCLLNVCWSCSVYHSHFSLYVFSVFLSLYESLWMTSSNLLIIIIFYLCKVYCSTDLWFFNFNDYIFLFLEFLCFFSRAACFYFVMSRSYIMNLIPLSFKHIYFKVCISCCSLRS